MKLNITLLISICLLGSIHTSAQTTKHALFLGNSYTYYNDLPQLCVNVAASVGDVLIVDSNTPGGTSFSDHCANATSLNLIAQGDWDFVVLQEQSQMPSFPIGQVEMDTYPFATQLNDSIELHNPCAETVFYMTWGRENGDAGNCANWPPVCTYEGMDDLLRERYMAMAEMNDAIVSPVGAVWRYLRENYPDIQLYNADSSHPSPEGSFAGAITFYTSMFRKDPLLVTYDYTIDNTTEGIIKQAVHDVVFAAMSTWHIGDYDPQAAIEFQQVDGYTYSINTISTNADEVHLEEGDQLTPFIDGSITHTFPGPGVYDFMVVASSCGMSDTTYYEYEVLSLGMEESEMKSASLVYPNPAMDEIRIGGVVMSGVISVRVCDMQGRVCLEKNIAAGDALSIADLVPGKYAVRWVQGEKSEWFWVVKE